MTPETIHDQVKRIRDFIGPRKRYVLSKNQALWHQLCSCLDVLQDSELATEAYSRGEFGESYGALYLAVYGLLQALVLQQDAADNLCESLGIPKIIDHYPRLKEIREVRNKSAGHPTKRGKGYSYHFISRATLRCSSFELISLYRGAKPQFEHISIPDLIADQRKYISDILILVGDNLEKEEAAHKKKFRTEKLTSLFDDPLNYQVGKIFEGIAAARGLRDLPPAVGEMGRQYVKRRLQAFRDALAKRGEHDAYEGLKDSYELLEYSLDELEKFFRDVKNGVEPKISDCNVNGSPKTTKLHRNRSFEVESNINERAARIFAFFIHKQVAELGQIAGDIDQDYSS